MSSCLDSAKCDAADDDAADDNAVAASEVDLVEESSLAAAAKTSNTSTRCNKLLCAA